MRVVLVVNPHKPIIEAAARQYQGPLELEFVPQPSYRGLGDALLATTEGVFVEPAGGVVTHPDHLGGVDHRELGPVLGQFGPDHLRVPHQDHVYAA